MKFLKMLLGVLGVLFIAAGGLFILQSLNIVRWPADSFMLGEASWSWKGSLVLLAGVVMIWFSRRK